MTTLQAAIPDDLHDALVAQAAREHISVDALISRTLRAARGNWEDFDRIMSRVADVPPAPGDER
jgi:hypothetical protein